MQKQKNELYRAGVNLDVKTDVATVKPKTDILWLHDDVHF